MQYKRLHCIVVLCVLSLILSSCKKKPASHAISHCDADVFFAQPTLSEYKSMQQCDINSGSSGVDRTLSGDGTTQVVRAAVSGSEKADAAFVCDEQLLHKLLGVPLPVDATIVPGHPDFCSTHELSIARYSAIEQDALYDFYLGMFEQAGWHLTGHIKESAEYLMVWEKPRKLCVVSLVRVSSAKKTGKKLQRVRVVMQVCERTK